MWRLRYHAVPTRCLSTSDPFLTVRSCAFLPLNRPQATCDAVYDDCKPIFDASKHLVSTIVEFVQDVFRGGASHDSGGSMAICLHLCICAMSLMWCSCCRL